jgi:hypothetical protein
MYFISMCSIIVFDNKSEMLCVVSTERTDVKNTNFKTHLV